MNITTPEAKQMTPQAENILAILRTKDDWMTRSQIATDIGKPRLNKWDIALLEMLAEHGYVVAEKRKFHGAIGFLWAYKAVNSDS
jgi:hypothetical protein